MVTLIIGLGGTGCQIAGHIYEMRGGEDGLRRSRMGIIAVDSKRDIDESPSGQKTLQRDGHFVSLGLGLSGTETMRTAKQKKNFLDWWPTIERGTKLFNPHDDFSDGAGKVRANGRYTYYQNGKLIMKRLEETLKSLGELEAIKNLKVYICCSSTNGTGSSMFVDVAFLLREVTSKLNVEPQIFGVVIDASVIENFGKRKDPPFSYTNSMRFYRELDFWMNNGDSVPYEFQFSDRSTIKSAEKGENIKLGRLLKFCFVISASNEMDSNLANWRAYIELAANSILRLSDDAAASFLDTMVAGSEKRYPNDYIYGRTCQYGSIGYSFVEFPDEKVLNYCGQNLAAELLDVMNRKTDISKLKDRAYSFLDINKIIEENPRDDLFDLISKEKGKLLERLQSLERDKKELKAQNVVSLKRTLDGNVDSFSERAKEILDKKQGETEEAIMEEMERFISKGCIVASEKWINFVKAELKNQMESVGGERPEKNPQALRKEVDVAAIDLRKIESSFFKRFRREANINSLVDALRKYYINFSTNKSIDLFIIFYDKLLDFLESWEETIAEFRTGVTEMIERDVDTDLPKILSNEVDTGKVSKHKRTFSVSVEVGSWRDFVESEFYKPLVDTEDNLSEDLLRDSSKDIIMSKIYELHENRENKDWSKKKGKILDKWQKEIKEDLLKRCQNVFSARISSATLDSVLESEVEVLLGPLVRAHKTKNTLLFDKEMERLEAIYGRENTRKFAPYLSDRDELVNSAINARLDTIKARTTPFWNIVAKEDMQDVLQTDEFWECDGESNPRVHRRLENMKENNIILPPSDREEMQKVTVFRVESGAPLNHLSSVQTLIPYDKFECKGNPCYSDARYLEKWNEEFWTPEDWITKKKRFMFAIGEACGYIKTPGRQANFRFGRSKDSYPTIKDAIDAVEDDRDIEEKCDTYLAVVGVKGKGKGGAKDKVRKGLTGLIKKYQGLAKTYSTNPDYEEIYQDIEGLIKLYMAKKDLKPVKHRKKIK